MNVSCTFKIGPFVSIKKDVFWTSFRRPENTFCLSSECVSIAIYIHEVGCCLLIFKETFFDFMIQHFMTLFEGMQNRWILFIRDFEILAPSWIDTRLLIKLRGIKYNRVGMKKNFGENLEIAKPSHSEQGRNWQQQGRESWWVGWVCLICKVTLEVS